MYRLIVESLLGIRLEVDKLYFAPRVPSAWNKFKVHFRLRETIYHITVLREADGGGRTEVTLDGVPQPGAYLLLTDDRTEHFAEVTFSASDVAAD
jgi:cellobiose phosphorylase